MKAQQIIEQNRHIWVDSLSANTGRQEKKMNAYELEQAAFDSACDYAEETVEYIQGYAYGAFDLYVSDELAQKILDCRKACREATEKNGEGENNGWHLVRKPLEQIEL